MVAGVASSFGLSEGATEFLTSVTAVGGFTILVNHKTRLADRIAHLVFAITGAEHYLSSLDSSPILE